MKLFDHDKPANRDEWVFALTSEYRKLRPEFGEKYAKVHALQAYNEHKGTAPAPAAKAWAKR